MDGIRGTKRFIKEEEKGWRREDPRTHGVPHQTDINRALRCEERNGRSIVCFLKLKGKIRCYVKFRSLPSSLQGRDWLIFILLFLFPGTRSSPSSLKEWHGFGEFGDRRVWADHKAGIRVLSHAFLPLCSTVRLVNQTDQEIKTGWYKMAQPWMGNTIPAPERLPLCFRNVTLVLTCMERMGKLGQTAPDSEKASPS